MRKMRLTLYGLTALCLMIPAVGRAAQEQKASAVEQPKSEAAVAGTTTPAVNPCPTGLKATGEITAIDLKARTFDLKEEQSGSTLVFRARPKFLIVLEKGQQVAVTYRKTKKRRNKVTDLTVKKTGSNADGAVAPK